jgi:sucrose phosphorylase
MTDDPQLITYPDRLAGDLPGLGRLLDGRLAGAFGGVHVLPFFESIDGADAGFDPTDHTSVDPRVGSWEDIRRLAATRTVCADLIVNHASTSSPQFVDWRRRGDRSPYASMFLTPQQVFGDAPTAAQMAAIYRPRPTRPFTDVRFADGTVRSVWTTFSPEQADLDVESDAAWSYLTGILDRFAEVGIEMVRLDAVGYAIKRPGTSCFLIPETFEFVDRLVAACHQRGLRVLVEVHGHHADQLRLAERVDLVYDFALPPLAIDALTNGDARWLKHWITIRPSNSVNVLDTHDGIGVIDVGGRPGDPSRPPLLPPDRIHDLVEGIHERTGGQSRRATGTAASNLDLYQVNTTYYDALGRDDARYLAARALQLLLPGIPQIYYVGLLAGENDMVQLSATGQGREINRHRYTDADVDEQLERPVVQSLLGLLRWRMSEPAFDGTFELLDSPDHQLAVRWTSPTSTIERLVDLRTATVADTNPG